MLHRTLAILSNLLLPSAVLAAPPAVQPKTAAAVIATSEAWSLAELGGDPSYVAWLLLPGYVSVNRDGTIRDRTRSRRALESVWEPTGVLR